MGPSWYLTHKQLETHVCVLSVVVTGALVLKHQATIIHSTDEKFIILNQFHTKY